MNPWEVLGQISGWVLLALLVIVILIIVAGLIVAVVKGISVKLRKRRGTQIFKSDREYAPWEER